MSSFELNKIFAALLVAAITAMLGGFIANTLIHPHTLEKDAVEIDGGAVDTAGPGAVALPDPILHLIASADIAKGEKLSKACAACHSFEQGGPAKVGPNLYGVVGAPKAGKGGFEYSTALREYGGAWSYEDLNKFLWKPKKLIDGTNMNYIGLKKPADRAAMIAWLRSQGSGAFPLPNNNEIAAEKAELAPEPPLEESQDTTAVEQPGPDESDAP